MEEHPLRWFYGWLEYMERSGLEKSGRWWVQETSRPGPSFLQSPPWPQRMSQEDAAVMEDSWWIPKAYCHRSACYLSLRGSRGWEVSSLPNRVLQWWSPFCRNRPGEMFPPPVPKGHEISSSQAHREARFTSSHSHLCSHIFPAAWPWNTSSALPSSRPVLAASTGFCPSWLSSKEHPYPMPSSIRNLPQNSSWLLPPRSPRACPWEAW